MSAGVPVLVIGGGGREHALAWKLAQSPRVNRVIVAPGNAGFDASWERWEANLGAGAKEFERLAKKALDAGVKLAVIGPDNPLADGIVDAFEKAGLPAFGPRAAAARIEASKAFAKEVMAAAGVPTAAFRAVKTVSEAREFLTHMKWKNGAVVKADGLALGKGVRVCSSDAEAIEAAEALLPVSGSLVIEERLSGEEVSWLALCDGSRAALLEPARDHKRLSDGDQGPNTGGMGAYSPVSGMDGEWPARVEKEVFLPVLAEMKKRGAEFRGVLYAGLMVDHARGKYWVLEFNARFGDPETQCLLPRVDGDIYPWFEAAAAGKLAGSRVPFRRESAVVIVGAAAGYPENPEKGRKIPDGEWVADAGYFWAGVRHSPASEGLETSGGRVVGAWALGKDLSAARHEAYERLDRVRFDGMQWRTDIGTGGAK